MWDYRAKLIEVHDGDTIKLLIDNGLGSRQEEAIRLKGVFAPELSQPGGPETRDFVETYLSNNMQHDFKWPLHVVTEPNQSPEPTEIRTFTRYVGVVKVYSSYVLFTPTPLNKVINEFLAQHPEWGKGIGG